MSLSRRFGRRTHGLVAVTLTALVASAGAVATSVPAEAATYYNVCGQRVTSQVFKAYGDTNEYPDTCTDYNPYTYDTTSSYFYIWHNYCR